MSRQPDDVVVTITVDVEPYLRAIRQLIDAFEQLPPAARRAARWMAGSRSPAHLLRHHRREDPRRSVMHAAYDRRRRARRRRNR